MLDVERGTTTEASGTLKVFGSCILTTRRECSNIYYYIIVASNREEDCSDCIERNIGREIERYY